MNSAPKTECIRPAKDKAGPNPITDGEGAHEDPPLVAEELLATDDCLGGLFSLDTAPIGCL